MREYPVSSDYRPITWIGRCPVYLTGILIAVYCVAVTACALYSGTQGGMPDKLFFAGRAVSEGHQWWSVITYPLAQQPSFWFVMDMLCFFWAGTGIEKFLGRRTYTRLYLVLILVAPLTMLAFLPLFPGAFLQGTGIIHISLVAAFALIYPSAQVFMGIEVRWVAVAIIALQALQFVAAQYWSGAMALAASILATFGLLYAAGVRTLSGWLGSLSLPKRTPRFKVLPPPDRPASSVKSAKSAKPLPPPPAELEDPVLSIDPLLDKIAREGLASLTPAERRKLEAARASLLDRSGGNP